MRANAEQVFSFYLFWGHEEVQVGRRVLRDLEEPRRSEVEELRNTILGVNDDITEHIKWNAPSYRYHGDDRITFNLHDQNHVRLILHAGSTTKEDKKAPPMFSDTTGLLKWNSNIRATVSFDDFDHIQTKKEDLKSVIVKWLDTFG